MPPSTRAIVAIAIAAASLLPALRPASVRAAEPERVLEATSLLGRPLWRPTLSDEAATEAEANLAAAEAALAAQPRDEAALIWVGRRLAYLGRYNDAVAAFTRALEIHPDSPRILRHRGHRWITLRKFAEAEADLARAAELARALPDEVEPDGQPNARNIPRSTLRSNICYHLGLARFLSGDFDGALAAYDEGMPFARANDDMLVAMADWRCRALMRLGRMEEAKTFAAEVARPEMDVIENHDYHRLLLLYSGRAKVDDVLGAPEVMKGGVAGATVGFGVANYLLCSGDASRAESMMRQVLTGDSWPSFGFIAAETDVARAQAAAEAADPENFSPHDTLRANADALAPLAESDLVRAFLAATPTLPEIGSRVVYYDPATRTAFTELQARREGLTDADLASLKRFDLDDTFYYFTNYGTPLAYARALDIAARHGFTSADGARILDFGYGTIGHLRLLASLGADAVGVDVDPILDALYSEAGDKGRIDRAPAASPGEPGRLRVFVGRWPGEPEVAAQVDRGYDLFISKNVLKNGYLHPERATEPRRLVRLGVDDLTFLESVRDALKPGALIVVYNLSPAPAPDDKPYIPWADGRFPFTRGLVETVGLEVLAWDEDDSEVIRRYGAALGWGDEAGLRESLFAHYTVLRRPAE